MLAYLKNLRPTHQILGQVFKRHEKDTLRHLEADKHLLTMSNATNFLQFTDVESEAFKQSLSSFKDNFAGLFSNPIINWTMPIVYLGAVVSWIGLLLVSWFEKTGQAGPYRTLVNQLISRKLDWIVILAGSCTVLQAARHMIGPLPEFACKSLTGILVFTSINICLLCLSVTAGRFTFAYIYKTIPVMDDDFWVKLINRVIMTWSALVTIAKQYTEDKVMITERICTGTWSDKDMELEPNPVAAIICVATLFLYAVMTFAIKIRQPVAARKNKFQSQNSSDLASTLATIMTTGSMCLVGGNFLILTKTGTPEKLSDFPGAWLVHLYAPILPFVLTLAQCISQYMNNPQLRKSVKRLVAPDRILSVSVASPQDQMIHVNV